MIYLNVHSFLKKLYGTKYIWTEAMEITKEDKILEIQMVREEEMKQELIIIHLDTK